LFFLFLSWVFRFFVLSRLFFWIQRNAKSFEKKKKCLDEKIVIKNDVSNLCETNNSSSSSLNESCVKKIKIEKEKEKPKSFFDFEFFAIDFALNYFHVNEIENLWNVVAIIEKVWKHQKIAFKKKEKKECLLKSSINIEKID
jgi:hypothetical protein